MKERLKELMTLLSVNAADLADRIGVQRSSVSHILNGRNLPSTQFIEKLLTTYPEIEARWLITGFGNPLRQPGEAVIDFPPEKVKEEKSRPKETVTFPETPVNNPVSKIEKVLVFYQDRSFIEYSPGK